MPVERLDLTLDMRGRDRLAGGVVHSLRMAVAGSIAALRRSLAEQRFDACREVDVRWVVPGCRVRDRRRR